MHVADNKNESIWKMPETVKILWTFFDITWVGLGGVSLLNTFFQSVNEVEKMIVFLMFVAMGIFRMIKMHHMNEEKRLNNQHKKIEIEKLKNGNKRAKKP